MIAIDSEITDIKDLKRHYCIRDGFVFSSFAEPVNVFDWMIIRNPEDSDCWSPVLGKSARSLEDHIQYIKDNDIRKVFVIAEDLSFIKRIPELRALKVYPADNAKDCFDYSPLYETKGLEYIDCATSYGGVNEDLHTTIDYRYFRNLKSVILSGPGHLNYEALKNLESIAFKNAPDPVIFDRLQSKTSLRNIELSFCKNKDLSGIETLKYITSMELSYNRQLDDLSLLKYLGNTLESLVIENCSRVKDFTFLEGLPHLKRLCLLGNNKLECLKFLEGMPKLQYFRFSMEVIDRDLTFCRRIPMVKCMKPKRDYNY